MSTKIELLKFLDENYGSFVSGECLAQTLGVSRAAVNKAASALKKSGYKILSRPSQGYCCKQSFCSTLVIHNNLVLVCLSDLQASYSPIVVV